MPGGAFYMIIRLDLLLFLCRTIQRGQSPV